jgi:cell division protein FtsW
MAQRLKTDWILFTTVVLMVLFGAVMIYSASSVVAQIRMGSSTWFALRQLIWIAVSIPLMMYLKRLHYRKLQTPAVAFTAMGLVTILLAVVYFADPRQHRWIRFGPFGGLQPSEFTKPALAMFLAYFIAMRSRAINSRYTLLPAILAVGFVTVSVALADLGTAIVLGATAAVVFIVAGLERRYILIVCAIGILGGAVFIAAKPYRLVRVVSYVDPGLRLVDKVDRSGWIRSRMKKSITAKDTNYQAEQAKIAIGSGGPMGVGLMEGRQKLFYLPEAHTDTIYAVVGEEFGLFGSIAVLIGFVVILWRGIRATLLIPDEFGRYLALGITTMLVIQAFFNMTVVLGMMPTKGIPLPMISFGGSSLLVTLASLGILLNVSEHAG